MTDTDPRLSAATIIPTVLAKLEAVASQRGYATDAWFAGTGTSVPQLTAPDFRMSFRQTATVLRRAMRALPADEPWGMLAAARDFEVAYGMVGLAMRSCRTFGEALMLGNELHQAGGSLMDTTLERFGDQVAVQVHERAPEPELRRFLCEEALTSAVMFSRSITGSDESATEIQVRFPEPPYVAEYRPLFRCPIRFDSDASRIIFPAVLLDLPVTTHNEASRVAAVEACRRLLEAHSHAPNDVVAVVETLLGENIRVTMTMGRVAARLSMTERTLRRQLSDAGERFSDLRDRVRRRRAAFLVRETRMPLAQVAGEVGYSDEREFRRAYLRWNGEPPSATRRAIRFP